MMIHILQAICSFLFAVGFLFILIDFRTNFDRSFRFFGISLILLCAMTSIDLWITPGISDPEHQLYWQKLYHLIACLFVPFSLWYLLIITSSKYLKYIRMVVGASMFLAAMFVSKKMLYVSGTGYQGSMLYNLLFVPFVLFYVLASNFIIVSKLRRSHASERKILLFHLVGFLVLCACGILDMAEVTNVFRSSIPSFSIIGVLGYGLMASMIFTERFLILLKEKDINFNKLQSAYKDLEQVNALKQLGESTAIINHEIKNYMFMISGNAQVLQEVEILTQKGKDIVKNIVTTVERLTDFSDDILKLSRTHILKEKHPVNLTELIKGAIEKHYPAKVHYFNLQNLDKDHFLFGDWGKLEQVFVNAFNNSIEAGQGGKVDIRVKITANNRVLLVSIEDNGVGCGKEELEGLFKAFYTTKKSQGGTGLGMSITRTIVEGHGGKISAYSKNLARKGEHGLKLIMSFPVYSQHAADDSQSKHPIVLIKEGMDNLPDLIRVFQNLRVSPYIIQDTQDLNETDFPPDAMTILVSAKTMASRFTQLSVYPRLCLVSNHERNLYILDHGRGNRPEVFSEEYVVSRLLRSRAMPRSRFRERQHHLAF